MATLNSPFMAAMPKVDGTDAGFRILSRKTGEVLGVVGWYERWQCYEFLPKSGTGYDAKCLLSLGNFCAELTKEQRG